MPSVVRRYVVPGVLLALVLTAVVVGATARMFSSPRLYASPVGASPSSAPATSPTLGNPIAPWTIAFGKVVNSNPGGALPGGCAQLLTYQVCVPDVTIDGSAVSSVAVLERMLGFATRPVASGAPNEAAVFAVLGLATTRQQGIAFAVEDELLYREGLTNTTGSLETATAMANQELKNYLADPSAGLAAGIVPAGLTPQQYFLSQTTIASYQREVVIAHEKSVLAAAAISEASWFGQALTNHTILVDGAAPSFSLPDAFVSP